MNSFLDLWALIISCLFVIYLHEARGWLYYSTLGLTLINVFALTAITVCMFQLYLAPLGTLSNMLEGNLAHHLVQCVNQTIPELSIEFGSIGDCIHDVNVYMVRKGRIPYMSRVPTAFVMSVDNESIFVTNYYDELDLYDKALVMIHECAHIGLQARDYAYVWEDSFNQLTELQHYRNADSFMKLVSDNC